MGSRARMALGSESQTTPSRGEGRRGRQFSASVIAGRRWGGPRPHRGGSSGMRISQFRIGGSRGRLEPLKPEREAISIRLILGAPRQVNGLTFQSLERFEHGPIFPRQQPVGNVKPIIGGDSD